MLMVVMLAIVMLAVNMPPFMLTRGNLSNRNSLVVWPPCQTDVVRPGVYMNLSFGKLEGRFESH
jgi:hypothetical protein